MNFISWSLRTPYETTWECSPIIFFTLFRLVNFFKFFIFRSCAPHDTPSRAHPLQFASARNENENWFDWNFSSKPPPSGCMWKKSIRCRHSKADWIWSNDIIQMGIIYLIFMMENPSELKLEWFFLSLPKLRSGKSCRSGGCILLINEMRNYSITIDEKIETFQLGQASSHFVEREREEKKCDVAR